MKCGDLSRAAAAAVMTMSVALLTMTSASATAPSANHAFDTAAGHRELPPGTVEFNGHRYLIYNDSPPTWDRALANCQSRGGYLASITSRRENAFLYQYITSLGERSAYFGGSDAAREGRWSWANGDPWRYSNWAVGEPNNESNAEDYTMFYWKFTDGRWNDGSFTGSTVDGSDAYLCEWGLTPRLFITAKRVKVRAGSRVTVSGWLSEPEADKSNGVLLSTWRKDARGRWRKQGLTPAQVTAGEDRSGFAGVLRFKAPGRYRIIAVHPAHYPHAAAISRSVTVVVSR